MGRRPVRAQLVYLLAMVLVPVFLVMAWHLCLERRQARAAANEHIVAAGQRSSANIARFLAENRALMEQLVSRPRVQALNSAHCDPFITEYATQHPEFLNALLTNLQGNAICAMAEASKTASSLQPLPWRQQAVKSDVFLAGNAFYGPVSKRWAVSLSQPVKNQQGRIAGVLMFGLDLLQLNLRLMEQLPSDILVVVTDAEHRTLLRSEQLANFIGEREALVTTTGGQRAPSPPDQYSPRLSVGTPIPGSSWVVHSSMSEADAFALPNTQLIRAVVAGLTLLLVALFLAWRISLRIVRPIESLAKVAQKAAKGDYDARAREDAGPAEIAAVAQQVNQMLAAQANHEQIVASREGALREREQRLSFLLSHTSAVIYTSRAYGDFGATFVSESVRAVLGYSPEQTMADPDFWIKHLHPDDVAGFTAARPGLLTNGMLVHEYRFLHATGEYRWIHDEIRLYRDAQGLPDELIGFWIDVTQRREAEQRVRANEARFRTLTELSADWYWEQDAQFRFIRIEEKARAFSESSDETRFGKTHWDSAAPNLSSRDWDRHRVLLDAHQQFRDLELSRVEPDGSLRWEAISGTPFFDEQGTFGGYRGVGRDITAQKQAAEKIHRLAYFDALTDLPNRRRLMEHLRSVLLAKTRSRRHGALFFLDLDHFKSLNDTQGHDMGDLLLKQVAVRLIEAVREVDTVARLGGDEFVLVLDDLSEDAGAAATQADALGQKILLALAQPYALGKLDYRGTPSIGITLFGANAQSVEELLKQADLAMYQAKSAGRNTLRFFDVRMQASVDLRVALERDLRIGLARGELVLHYQPVVHSSGRVTGAEALVRWNSPERGLVSPAEFIPLAETTNLIGPLGSWVLQTACAQLATWASAPALARLTLAVNVSAHQFREPGFVAKVLQTVQMSGAAPDRLKLELTESLLAHDVEDIIDKMTVLKSHGIGFSLDDFGTGYSSLSYLKRLPLDQLKIDRSFVRDVLDDRNDAAIARTIVALAHSLELDVVAEGVETEGQRDFLLHHGCHTYQGYLFSRPLPIALFDAFVDARC